MAADGTISISTSALAIGAVAVHSPRVSTTVKSPRIHPRITPPHVPLPWPRRKVVNHTTATGRFQNGRRRRPPGGSPPPTKLTYLLAAGRCRRGLRTRCRRGRLGRRAQHPLDVGLHLLQLSTPVGPVVHAVGREVEHTVLTARGDVLLLERLVRAAGEALKELDVE